MSKYVAVWADDPGSDSFFLKYKVYLGCNGSPGDATPAKLKSHISVGDLRYARNLAAEEGSRIPVYLWNARTKKWDIHEDTEVPGGLVHA